MKIRFFLLLPLVFVFHACVNGEKPPMAQQEEPVSKGALTVSILGPDGKTMTLSDGRKFEIYPEDQNVAAGWFDSDLQVKNNQSADYPFTIYNKVTNDSVRARLSTS